jgi:diacylglycerol O-acyltransferase / wax synthase
MSASTMQRLSTLDASFLEVEDAVSHMHVGSVAIFEGPPPSYEELRRAVLCKLPLLPRYRQLAQRVPLGAGRPVWVDDPHFNIDYHLRRTALPAPGGEPELCRLVGRVMSQQLDRTKPLWETWVIEGLDGGRWAMLSKTHHCMVDGISASDLLTVILDSERDVPPPAESRWSPRPLPGSAEMLGRALGEDLFLIPWRAARALGEPGRLALQARDTAQGLLRMRGVVAPNPPSSLNGPLGPSRRWGFARARLADVKTVRAALGGTVNDVVLACITGGFRDLLIARREPVEQPIRTLVPVSVRTAGERGVYNNRVSAIFAELPVEVPDPRARLESIRLQMEDLKRSKEAVAGEVLTSLGGFAPPMLLALAERLGTRVPQHSINTVTTNVPGPQRPLYAAGREMLEAFPYVPLGGHVRMGVAIYSYNGALTFGVTGDYDTAADLDVLCAGIERALEELLESSGARSRRGTVAARRRRARRGRAAGAATSDAHG